MDDPALVRGREPGGDLERVVNRLPQRQRWPLSCSRSVAPSRSSDTRNGAPPCEPNSWTTSTFGWLSAPAAHASCSNRRRRSASAENDSGKTLRATSRARRVSLARYTSPIPPAPIRLTMSYGPRRAPAVRGMDDGSIGANGPMSQSGESPTGQDTAPRRAACRGIPER
jgi:hypothetical protein